MANQQGEAYISAEDLRRFVTALFENAGLPSADAFTVADCLVLANVRGVDTHGVFRVSTYLKRLRKGLVAPCPDIRITPISQAIASIDGSDGMGAVVGMKAMTECIKLGCETGLGLVSVKRGTHYGMAAYYVLHAVENGMIGMAFTNASPALPPWGGRAPFFGTSPLAVGVPSGTQPDYILDMAMSVLARGNVYIAAEKEASISAGLAYDADGHPTTDPRALIENGTMLPFGGVKGAALSMLMDILGGVLSGANFGGEVSNPHMNFERLQNVGHLFITIRPDLFMPQAKFLERMDTLIKRMKAQPKANGFDEILVPGEREARTQAQRLHSGIPLIAEVVSSLKAEGERADIAFPRISNTPLQ